jgi:hypothetical protein
MNTGSFFLDSQQPREFYFMTQYSGDSSVSLGGLFWMFYSFIIRGTKTIAIVRIRITDCSSESNGTGSMVIRI